MKFPYKVKVTGNRTGVNIKVTPEPIASKPEYAEQVTKRISEVILGFNGLNTIATRLRLKNSLTSVLQQLHAMDMIVPKKKKEKDEGNEQ